MGKYRTHIKVITMQSIAQVQNVQKINAVSTGKVANEKSMMVWRPHGNKMFETFSFLPPLSDADLTKQVQYLLNNGWTPCLEFEDPAHAYTDGHGWSGLDSSVNANYYDNRYWVMWKLPMYGCNNADEVIQEVSVRQGVPELLRQMRRLRQHQASAMCWLLVLQTEVGPDERWCQTSR